MNIKLVRSLGGKPITLTDGARSKDMFDLTIAYAEEPGGPTHTRVFRLSRELVLTLRHSLDQTWAQDTSQAPGSQTHQ
jgi:hypothetical protein